MVNPDSVATVDSSIVGPADYIALVVNEMKHIVGESASVVASLAFVDAFSVLDFAAAAGVLVFDAAEELLKLLEMVWSLLHNTLLLKCNL